MITLDYMRAQVRSRLDDTDFESTFIDLALNQAQRDITNNRNLTFLETTTTSPLAAGATTAVYPAAVRNLLSLRVSAVGQQDYEIADRFVDYADFQDGVVTPMTSTTAPVQWTKFGSNIIFPAPADKLYTLTFNYVRNSPTVNATQPNFDIPDEYEELLLLGAYIRIAKREDDYEVSAAEMTDYTRELKNLIHDYSTGRGAKKIHIMRRGR